MTETRDAAVKISIRPAARGEGGDAAGVTWVVSDYCVQRIGGQSAGRLRTLLVGPLVSAVDDVDAAVLIHAASSLHARLYRAAVDGFVDVGPAWPRGRRLYRPRRSERARPTTVDQDLEA
ncbi:hypothetical protein [Microbacterium testaceum]|uniref:hypothetical protein n=1 Tax=Microbacterium testaceum TaxID=2033 RepID=UPI002AC515B8|nr:hypothetical protein [Microbacterium testaceum]MDZ5146370.1 hypothetical protein [Microbacterium testaceum]